MSDVFDFVAGSSPLLISIPHDGRRLAPDMADRMTAAGRALPDTDWHVRRLYGFASELQASVIAANYSRYVVDLNRPADDAALYPGQLSTGLCPAATFAGEPIYANGAGVSAGERRDRVNAYWQPYHDKLRREIDRTVSCFGYALLWDAHSIRAEVPSLFDGRLPDLNIGTNDGASCAGRLAGPVAKTAAASPYSVVSNGRFKGGFITRGYGVPTRGVHAIQLELAQRAYMDEVGLTYDAGGAEKLQTVIRGMLETFMASAEAATNRPG
jgi:N-formylglutamate amidohydrolase